MPHNDELTIALVGCGGIAQAHWRGIETRARRIRVTAVVDSDPGTAEEMAAKTGATAFPSLGELRTALAMYRSAETRRWEKVW